MSAARAAMLLFLAGLLLGACAQPPKPPGGFGNPDPATESPDH